MTSKVDTPLKITDYFPPSPKSEDAAGVKSTGCTADPVDEVSTALPDCVPDKLTKTLSGSSLLITPKSSPSKDESTGDQIKATDDQTKAAGDQTRTMLAVDKTEPETVAEGSASVENKSKKVVGVKIPGRMPTKPQRRKGKKGKEESAQSSRITDFFPVRRSDRRCQSLIEKEEKKTLEENLLNGVEDGLKIQNIENKGRGVVATKPFKRGAFVVEYAGDLINLSEAKQRDTKYSKDATAGSYMYYFCFKNKNYCIDATAETGKLGRLLNHSKTAGNCRTKLVECGGRPHLIIVAARDIEVGDELQYDYGDRSKASLESHPWLKS